MYISFLQRLAPQLVVYCPVTDPHGGVCRGIGLHTEQKRLLHRHSGTAATISDP